jgi:AraC-like DNA-binding protein
VDRRRADAVEWGMDVLDDVLRELRFESAAYRWLELGAPFLMTFREPGLRGVHLLVRGSCTLAVDGDDPVRLAAGDLVLLPRGDPHVLRSSPDPGAPPVSGVELVLRTAGARLRSGGKGEEVVVVCGAFVSHAPEHPALTGLPHLVHVAGQDGRPQPWVAPFVDVLAGEAFAPGPGSEMVMSRVSDALVARALRHHAETGVEPGWLHGLRDRHVSLALAVMHADPARGWTVASLATVAGLSRAAFAARFQRSVGESPMRYLTRLRVHRALTLLREQGVTLAAAARSVGYGSEAALSAAVKRHTGRAPGAQRTPASVGDEPAGLDHAVTAGATAGPPR